MTSQEEQDRGALTELGVTDDDINEAMGPVVDMIERMAKDQDRDPEEFFLSLPYELFGALAVGYLAARNAGHTGTELQRTAARNTAHALEHDGRTDLAPLALALGRYAD
ncbi:hypothetical protein [Streptomyces sp. NPDC005408]|uniref:hypothetical protein n=1 Tax=Streptomyces sp. NPDC005408 TaxID=3155341 RepID=UPI0033A0FE55